MTLLADLAAILPVEALRRSRQISPEALDALDHIEARRALRPHRQEAARKGVETRKAKDHA